MTDQELKDLVASLAVEHRKTELMMQETDRMMQEADCKWREERKEADCKWREERKEADCKWREEREEAERKWREECEEAERRSQAADRRLERLEKKMQRMGILVGGINDNIGYHAEQFFQDVFDEKLEFGGIKYDEMIPNLAYKDKGVKIEFDVVLLNGDSIALIEVKNRIHPDFVKELAEERVGKFREFFPRYSNYNVYLGIAGFSFSDEVLDRASSYGIGIIKQVGEGVEIEANNLKAY
jgi:hypothetical protein